MYWHLDFFWQAIQTPFRSYLSDMLALVSALVSPYHFVSSQIWLITCLLLSSTNMSYRYSIFIVWGLANFFFPLFLSLLYCVLLHSFLIIKSYQITNPQVNLNLLCLCLCYLKLVPYGERTWVDPVWGNIWSCFVLVLIPLVSSPWM